MSAEAYADLVLALDPVAYWPCDETSGSTLADLGPRGLDASLFGTLANVTTGIGNFNSLIDWDGSSMLAEVGLHHFGVMAFVNSDAYGAVAFWASFNGFDGGSWGGILGNTVGSAESGWGIYFEDAAATNQIRFGTSNGTFSGHNYADNSVPDANLHFFVLNMDGTNAALYRDGSLVSSTTVTKRIGAMTDAFNLGGIELSGTSYRHNGLLGQVSLHQRPLTAAEMTQLYNYGTTVTRNVSGNITVGGSPVAHQVRAIDVVTGRVVGEAVSNGSGNYSMDVSTDNDVYVFEYESPFVDEPARIHGPITVT